jgi:16S rRNA (adenine1518-N6/adenine1519-N6)-dimethyltransferase
MNSNTTDKKTNYRPLKRFGQHWLKSEKVLDKIVLAAEISKSDRILEIGAGTGILTSRLLEVSDAVTSVEIDRNLCKKLLYKFGNLDNFLLLQGDFISLDINQLLQQFPKFQNPNKIVANIPYNITGLILEKIFGTIYQPAVTNYESIILLIQKEVGDRLVAKPGTKAYSALSVRMQYLAYCDLVCDVPAKAFSPPPKVDSVVVKLRPRIIDNPANNPQLLGTLIKLGFANRRKMLRNNLKSLITVEELTSILEKLAINPQSRAENLSVRDWINFSNNFPQL